jgi:hypothetical protein
MAAPQIRFSEHGRDDLPAVVPALVDEMLACYVDWRERAAAVADAYSRWSGGRSAEEAARFAAYRAALDLEQAAAIDYGSVVTDLRRRLGSASAW